MQQACRITFFTRDNCGLCTQAKGVLSDVWDKRPFAYKEVNLALPESNSWRELYDFDIPVVSRVRIFHWDAFEDYIDNFSSRFTSARPTQPKNKSRLRARPSN
jgi:hypothetical protein